MQPESGATHAAGVSIEMMAELLGRLGQLRDEIIVVAIDPLDAVALDERLPEKFLSIRYPRFKIKLMMKREHYAQHVASKKQSEHCITRLL
jgi:hypothetical protein